jgi:hypothetical protein
MYRARRYWDNFNSSDPVTQGIAIVALVLLVIFALPYFNFPWQSSGANCLDLASPRVNGTNQSLLASQVDPSLLHLELVPGTISINPGDPLQMQVRFINESVAPFTLFLTPDQGIFRYTQQESGLLFSVQTNGVTLGEPTSVRPLSVGPQTYGPDQLHILPPRQRCTFFVTITADRLRSANVTSGQFQITAVYRNQYKGAIPAVGQLTPTPVFPDLGVWTGQTQSNDIVVNIGVPTPAK